MKTLLYTHSDVRRVWPAWTHQTKKYLPYGITVFCDDKNILEDEMVGLKYFPIVYSNAGAYTDRLLSCLNQMDNEDVVLFQHEDMFLYDKPDLDLLEEYAQMVKDDQVHFIKLLKSTEEENPLALHETLFMNSRQDLFCVQPHIVKVKFFKVIVEAFPNLSIWELEGAMAHNDIQLVSAYAYRTGRKRGLFHYDSDIYPYVATAIRKGQWNFEEYTLELDRIFKEIE